MNADPGYEWEETPRSERLLAALAGHTLGMAPVNATRTSLRAPLLRLPADQSRSAKLGDGKRAAHRSPVRSLSPHNRRPAERSPDSGVDMATQKHGMRGLGFAAAAGSRSQSEFWPPWPHSDDSTRNYA